MALIDISKLKNIKHQGTSTPLPKYIHKLVGFLQSKYNTEEENLIIVLRTLYGRMGGNRAQLLLNKLQPILFPNQLHISIDKAKFNFKFDRFQRRSVNIEDMNEIKRWIRENQHKHAIYECILFIFETGLRLFEVLQIELDHLKALYNEETIILIQRKRYKPWFPVYTSNLNNLVKQLFHKYDDDIHKLPNVKIWPYHPSTIHFKMQHIYTIVTKSKPYLGFGCHSIRNWWATKKAAEGKIELAQYLLGHQNITTTNKYVGVDTIKVQEKLEKIDNPLYNQVMEELKVKN